MAKDHGANSDSRQGAGATDPARRDSWAKPPKCTFSGSRGQKQRKSGIFEAFAPQRLTTTWAFTEAYMATTRNIPRLTLFLTTRGDFARFSLSGGHEQEASVARSKAGSASQRATAERRSGESTDGIREQMRRASKRKRRRDEQAGGIREQMGCASKRKRRGTRRQAKATAG